MIKHFYTYPYNLTNKKVDEAIEPIAANSNFKAPNDPTEGRIHKKRPQQTILSNMQYVQTLKYV